jgi:hypothetical protein
MGFSPILSLLVSAYSLPVPPAVLAGLPSQATGMLPYRSGSKEPEPAASASCLSPVTFLAQARLTSELLRFL